MCENYVQRPEKFTQMTGTGILFHTFSTPRDASLIWQVPVFQSANQLNAVSVALESMRDNVVYKDYTHLPSPNN